ncbi:phosphonate metabolism transcriptional regulator PhnF [Paraburkholderia sp. BR14263]|uniref:phosphonate metabolism transcriptional regulator PhnF n=2 Tax=Paraburkholderia TaxID=1822464 RepID=UPI0034CD9182
MMKLPGERVRQRSSRVPMWRQIEATLKGEIVSGALKPGAQLPPEGDISERFAVTRATARKALASLQISGLIRIEPGRGTFVQGPVFPYELSGATRFCHFLTSLSVDAQTGVLSVGVARASPEIAEALRLPPTARVDCIKTIASADGWPIVISENFVSEDRFPGFADTYQRCGSINETFRKYGQNEKRRSKTELVSRLPTDDEAHLLQQPKTRPIVEATLTMVDPNGHPVWIDISCFSADRVKLVLSET